MAEVAQMNCHAICIGSFSISPTKYVVFFCAADTLTQKAHAFHISVDNAFTHTHIPMCLFPTHRRFDM